MIKWINSDKNDVEDFLSNNHVIFIPMPNPDGVAEGTCKRTLGGYDFEPKRDGFWTTEPEPASIRDFFYRPGLRALVWSSRLKKENQAGQKHFLSPGRH